MKLGKLGAYRVVQVVDLEPIDLSDGMSLAFRIEVLEALGDKGSFRARVSRHESFRIQSSFPQKRGKPSEQASDEEILVTDQAARWNDLIGKTPDEVVQAVIKKIQEITNR
jgi:hypothetical protein